MKDKVFLVIRILLGLMLVLFGLNKFIGFMPMPPLPDEAGQFMGALAASGYIFPTVAVIEIGVGVLLLINRYVALALLLLAPISVNIILFHLFLDLKGIGGALIVTAFNIVLLFAYKAKYDAVLTAK